MPLPEDISIGQTPRFYPGLFDPLGGTPGPIAAIVTAIYPEASPASVALTIFPPNKQPGTRDAVIHVSDAVTGNSYFALSTESGEIPSL